MHIDAVHILAPGPSLVGYCPPPADDPVYVVAVNAAALYCRADAWCAMDAWTHANFDAQPARHEGALLHISRSANREMLIRTYPAQRDKWQAARFAFVERCVWPSSPKNVPDPQSYSTTAAIVWAVEFARMLGVHQVDLYGADMEGTADWRGVDDPTRTETSKRGLTRWDKERAALSWTMQEAQRRMVHVRRHLPDGVAT